MDPAFEPVPLWIRHLSWVIGASVALWFMGGHLYLRWLNAETARMDAAGGALTAAGDAPGIPLTGFLVLWGGVLTAIDLLTGVWLFRQARRRRSSAAT